MRAAAFLVLASLQLASVHAAPAAPRAVPARSGFAHDFRALAQQRPRDCRPPANGQDSSAWPDGKAACAWQNRLRQESWSWSDGAPSACISAQARWWSRAQAALPPGAPRSVWDARWTVQTLHFAVGGEERVLILQRDGKARWHATEWRWTPNPRPATRRWQQGRWKLLLDSAAQLHSPIVTAGTSDAMRMQPVFRRVLGARPGELGPDGMALEAAGLCLRAGNPLAGQPKLSLSYSPNDSRLEQRAAMHLQLSRQYPGATWLTQFKMLAMPPHPPSGAKFLATWVEGGQVSSQLWMPAKNDTATVRVRVSTRLPRGQDGAAAVAKAQQVLEGELEAIAAQWAAAYE